jgi:hypothetical protein
MAEERSLPGWPKKKLVKEVRSHLSHYGIRPTRFTIWQATWSWAHAIARSYFHGHWPLPSEIGTQYILLLLAEMKQSHMLRLPYRAREIVPPEVADLLPVSQQPDFPAIEFGNVARVRNGRMRQARSTNALAQRELFHEPGP